MAKQKKEKMITRSFTYSTVSVRYVKPDDDVVHSRTIILPNVEKLSTNELVIAAGRAIGEQAVSAEIVESTTARFGMTESFFLANATQI